MLTSESLASSGRVEKVLSATYPTPSPTMPVNALNADVASGLIRWSIQDSFLVGCYNYVSFSTLTLIEK
ncbi:MAG: hypothetical protein AB8B66_02620 [Rickettsiaceae bacterium]